MFAVVHHINNLFPHINPFSGCTVYSLGQNIEDTVQSFYKPHFTHSDR